MRKGAINRLKMTKKKTPTKKVPTPRNIDDKFIRQPPLSILSKKMVDVFVSPSSCWSPIAVRSAIDSHDIGNFNQSGKLVDAMLRDTRVMACVNTLTFGILGLPFEWKWQDDTVTSQSTDVFTPTPQDLDCLEITKKMWKKVMQSTVPSLLMKQIINMGFSIMSRNWELQYIDGHDEKLYVPNLYIFHPSNTFYVSGMYQYGVNTYNRGTIFIDEDGDERFQIVKHVDGERPWMQGAVRSVGFSWIDKSFALGDWRSYLGIHGNPLRILTTNKEYSTPPEFDIEQFLMDLSIAQQYGRPVQIPEGHTLDLLQAASANGTLFKDKLEDADSEISIAYLGQNLTTDVSGGSLAAANVHSAVKQDYIEAYATTINMAMQKLVTDFYKFNFPDTVKVPVPYFNPVLPIDKVDEQKASYSKAQTIDLLVKSIDTLSKIDNGKYMGVIDIEQLLKNAVNMQ